MTSARSRSASGMAASTLDSAERRPRANGIAGRAARATAMAAASAAVTFSGGEGPGRVQDVAPAAARLRPDRDAGLQQRVDVALDGADRDLEPSGEPGRRPPGRPALRSSSAIAYSRSVRFISPRMPEKR